MPKLLVTYGIHGGRGTTTLHKGAGFVLAISLFLHWFRKMIVVGLGRVCCRLGSTNVVGEVGLGWGLYHGDGY